MEERKKAIIVLGVLTGIFFAISMYYRFQKQ